MTDPSAGLVLAPHLQRRREQREAGRERRLIQATKNAWIPQWRSRPNVALNELLSLTTMANDMKSGWKGAVDICVDFCQ